MDPAQLIVTAGAVAFLIMLVVIMMRQSNFFYSMKQKRYHRRKEKERKRRKKKEEDPLGRSPMGETQEEEEESAEVKHLSEQPIAEQPEEKAVVEEKRPPEQPMAGVEEENQNKPQQQTVGDQILNREVGQTGRHKKEGVVMQKSSRFSVPTAAIWAVVAVVIFTAIVLVVIATSTFGMLVTDENPATFEILMVNTIWLFPVLLIIGAGTTGFMVSRIFASSNKNGNSVLLQLTENPQEPTEGGNQPVSYTRAEFETFYRGPDAPKPETAVNHTVNTEKES